MPPPMGLFRVLPLLLFLRPRLQLLWPPQAMLLVQAPWLLLSPLLLRGLLGLHSRRLFHLLHALLLFRLLPVLLVFLALRVRGRVPPMWW